MYNRYILNYLHKIFNYIEYYILVEGFKVKKKNEPAKIIQKKKIHIAYSLAPCLTEASVIPYSSSLQSVSSSFSSILKYIYSF